MTKIEVCPICQIEWQISKSGKYKAPRQVVELAKKCSNMKKIIVALQLERGTFELLLYRNMEGKKVDA